MADGLSQVPEGRHVFAGLTVMENLEMGAFLHNNREENQANLRKIFARFPRLEERKTRMQLPFRWGATDVGHGTCPNEPTKALAP